MTIMVDMLHCDVFCCVVMCFAVFAEVPLEYEEEVLNDDDPDSYYFMYVCVKDADMVRRKRDRLLNIDKKAAAKKKTRKGAFRI